MQSVKFLVVITLVGSTWGQESGENPCKGEKILSFVANPEACEKYIMCRNEMPRFLECKPGLWFSSATKQCLPKAEVDCRFNDPVSLTTEGRAADEVSSDMETISTTTVSTTTKAPTTSTMTSTTVTTTTTPQSTTTTTPRSTTTTRTTARTPTTTHARTTTNTGIDAKAEISCPATNPRNVQFIASPKDCGIYYLCYNGDPVLLKCSFGMHWNSVAKMCDKPENAKCKIDTHVPERFDCPNTGEVFIPHSVNCNWYFFCNEGIPMLQQCPFLHYFDVDKKRCVLRFLARCALAVRRERI